METRGGIREMDEAGRRGRVLWRRRRAGQRCNRLRYIKKKKERGQKGRSVVMVRKVIDDSKSEKGRGSRAGMRHKGEEMNRGAADGFK